MQEHGLAFPGRDKGAEEREKGESQETRDARRSRPASTWAQKAFIRPGAVQAGCLDRRKKEAGSSAAVVTMNGMRMSPSSSGMTLVQPHANASVLLAHFDAPLAVRSAQSTGTLAPAPPRAGWCTQRSDPASWEDEAASFPFRKDVLGHQPSPAGSPPDCQRQHESQADGERSGLRFSCPLVRASEPGMQQIRPNTATTGAGSAPGAGAGRWRGGGGQAFTRLLPSTATSADRERLRFGGPMQSTSRTEGGAAWPSSTLEAVSSGILISGSALSDNASSGASSPPPPAYCPFPFAAICHKREVELAPGWTCMAEPAVQSRKLKATTLRARASTRPPGSASRPCVGAAGAKMLEMELMAQRVWQGGLLDGLSGKGGVAVLRTQSDAAERDTRGHGARAPVTPVTLRVSPHAIDSLLPDYKPKGGSMSGGASPISPSHHPTPTSARPAVRRSGQSTAPR